jgi:glycosyltransferase involved in cell wall biosynthesis
MTMASEAAAGRPDSSRTGLPPQLDPLRVDTWFRHPRVRIRLLISDVPVAITPSNANDVYIVRNAWYPEDVDQFVSALRAKMEPLPRQIYFLSNTLELHQARLAAGFNSSYVNFACFIDERIFRPQFPAADKRFDAVYTARFSRERGQELKRHYLTRKIPQLALLDPVYASNDPAYRKRYAEAPNCAFVNDRRLPPSEVAAIIRQSWCGLSLSRLEGVCRASAEYLLCGIPVVSTLSRGGRDVWYDDTNSIIVPDASPESIHAAVEHFKRHPPDPQLIHDGFLSKARIFRDRFISDVIGKILADFDVPLDPRSFLENHPMRWWPRTTRRVRLKAAVMRWAYAALGR